MLAKNCPRCSYRYTFRRYAGLMMPVGFMCPSCRAPLRVNLRTAALAALAQGPLLAGTIRLAFGNPWYWLLMPFVGGLTFLIGYALFEVRPDGIPPRQERPRP